MTWFLSSGNIYKDLKMYDDIIHDIQKEKNLDSINKEIDILIKESSWLKEQVQHTKWKETSIPNCEWDKWPRVSNSDITQY